MAKFVDAYAKSTGQKQLIPESWLDHPVLGQDFELTPRAKSRRGELALTKTSPAKAEETPVEQADSKSATDETPENGDKE